MAAGIWNSVIEQGATWQKTFVYKDAAGQPIDIRGADIRLQARDFATSPTKVVDLSVGSGIQIVNDDSGAFTATVTDVVTSGIAVPLNSTKRNLVYDILLSLSGSGVVYRILKGVLEVSPGVTR